jgi:putative intracellular protease/amidase
VTEVAVPWAILRDAGHQVVFATEKAGTPPAADPRLLTGVLFGRRFCDLLSPGSGGSTDLSRTDRVIRSR